MECGGGSRHQWLASTAGDNKKRNESLLWLQMERFSPGAAELVTRQREEIEVYQKKVAELSVMVDFFKKTPDIGGHSTRERVEWVDRHYEEVGTKKKACQMMNLSWAAYYADPKVSRAEQDADLRDAIEARAIGVSTCRVSHALALIGAQGD